MRTRRSPKNQERLWRALGGPPEPEPEPVIQATCYGCEAYPPGGRGRGHCAMTGTMVRGSNVGRPCFDARSLRTPGEGESKP